MSQITATRRPATRPAEVSGLLDSSAVGSSAVDLATDGAAGSDAVDGEWDSRVVRSLFVSDVHLGCKHSQADEFLELLQRFEPRYLY
ncbi:MAG: hypothetical protein AAF589_09365, partial [Planctomycetota bacterium]